MKLLNLVVLRVQFHILIKKISIFFQAFSDYSIFLISTQSKLTKYQKLTVTGSSTLFILLFLTLLSVLYDFLIYCQVISIIYIVICIVCSEVIIVYKIYRILYCYFIPGYYFLNFSMALKFLKNYSLVFLLCTYIFILLFFIFILVLYYLFSFTNCERDFKKP